MPSVLTQEQIEAVIEALPIQYRIMIRLLLLQYIDVTKEEIEHMAGDRPDPRLQLGEKSIRQTLSLEMIQSVADRAEQYRAQVRQKRERIWLQTECLRKQIARGETVCRLAEDLMKSRFAFEPEAIRDLKRQARSAVPKPAMRALDKKWAADEISEEDYQKARLPIEYQTELRRLERYRKRLETAQRELAMSNRGPLQDHEIAHIWGIPLSSLAARKVKALHQYLQGLQAKLHAADQAPATDTTAPTDLWKETFEALSTSPVQRSIATYDGMEGTEAALTDKLTAFATGTLSEDIESRFWQTVSRDYSPNAVEGQGKRQSLFALQRLSAILSDIDISPDSVEQDLLTKISPTPKVAPGVMAEPAPETVPQLGEMAEHVLRSFRGEERR